jgi:hypothetical protein
MEAFRRIGAIVVADLRQRMRQQRFWWLMGLLILAAWQCLPPVGTDGAMTVTVGEGRAFYSSAWVGMVLALTASTLLSLLGFYAARGSIANDIDSRGWELLMATPMTRMGYLFAKYLGVMSVFGMYLIAIFATGLVAQHVRGEVAEVAVGQMLLPLVLITLPALAVTAACIVVFDVVPWLRATLGNVTYFFLWTFLLVIGTASQIDAETPEPPSPWILATDMSGMAVLFVDILPHVQATAPHLASDDFAIGGGNRVEANERFVWNAWSPNTETVLARLVLMAIALATALSMTPLVDWAAARPRRRMEARAQPGLKLRWLEPPLRLLNFSRFGRLIAAELRLALRPRAWWWWLVLLGAFGAQLASEPMPQLVGVLLALGISLPQFARMPLRDLEWGTDELLRAGQARTGALGMARMLASGVLALLLVAPALVDSGDLMTAAALVACALSLAWGGAALSLISRNARTTELLFVLSAYLALNAAPVFSPFAFPAEALRWHGLVTLCSAVLLVMLARRR